ncbi:hypothetical protein FACS18945_1700 [Bacteroidia bacterium]|nr:hypothetical protein FACS18945_1700 [Bacteroidia bacterium]
MERQPPQRTSRINAALVRLCLIIGVMASAGGLPLCGLTVFAAETGAEQTATSSTAASQSPLPPYPQDVRDEVFPVDVQTIIDGNTRQIVKTYALADGENPTDISRASFARDGWQYELSDILHKRVSSTDTRAHTETVTLNTDTNDLNAILKQLAPTLDYSSEDGYSGVLSLDLSTVTCEIAGQKNETYTVSTKREYPHLSSNDSSLIPKSITEDGRTLQLADVSWAVERADNVDYEDVANVYTATAKYTGKASKSTITGYVTTAKYGGEIIKLIEGDAIYTAYFEGSKIPQGMPGATADEPTPTETATPAPTETATEEPTSEPAAAESATATTAPSGSGEAAVAEIIAAVILIAALVIGGGAFWFMRRNVKVYALKEGLRTFAGKVRLNARSTTADLSKLDGGHFLLEIGKFSAKMLSGKTVEVTSGGRTLKHVIAYEGNAYSIEADFGKGTIKAVY